MPSLIQESYLSHLLAQKLNNRGCVLVNQGQYEQSIATFVRALKLSEASANEVSCSCRYCTLNSCILTSTSFTAVPGTLPRIPPTKSRRHSSGNKRTYESSATAVFDDGMEVDEEAEERQQQHGVGSCAPSNCFANPEPAPTCISHGNTSKMSELSSHDGRYLHCIALRVPSQAIKHRHNMGVTLSLIIIFNLALAHHLMGITSKQQEQQHHENGGSSSNINTSIRMTVDNKLLQKALQLYELAYQLHVDEQHAAAAAIYATTSYNDPTVMSQEYIYQQQEQRLGMLRFTLIVSNNLSEIHRVMNSPVKHNLCLEHLLSTLMYLIDGHYLTEEDSFNTTTATSIGSNPRINSIAKEELDGFLRNTSSLMLQDNCASAA
jgi:tetratricopeptide (TPR) repeat protein